MDVAGCQDLIDIVDGFQGLDGQLISPPANLNRSEPIVCREYLGGFLRFYEREAA